MIKLPSVWFVGCGNMAGALIEGWRKADVDFSEAIAVRPSGKPVEGLRTVTEIPDGPPPARCVLGFKPQKLDEIVPKLAPRLSDETVVVSMLAGVEVASLRERFPQVQSIVRIMPNLPVSERKGVTALFSPDADADLRARMGQLFGLLGIAIWTDTEAEFGAIGALAGAGPAYVARFIAAMAQAGEERGLQPDVSARIALQTVLGTAAMAEARGEDMGSIAQRVASPKGTTEAGLAVLDEGDALDRLVSKTLQAASRRSAELAAAARG